MNDSNKNMGISCEIEFSRHLIQGRIAETIFSQMIKEENRYTILPFGYEHTVPMLAQYRKDSTAKNLLNDIAHTPDFILLSNDKRICYLVEVKYQKKLNMELLQSTAKKLSERWYKPWIFVATPEGFYCSICSTIVEKDEINELSEKWVNKERQNKYLKLLNEFKLD